MANTKGTFLSIGASGKIAKQLVASKWKGKKVVREYVVPANPQTVPQQAQRSTFAAAVAGYHDYIVDDLIMSAWNSKALSIKRTMSGYNACVGAMKNVLALDPAASFVTGLSSAIARDSKLLLHYKMNDDLADTNVIDSSVNGSDGTAVPDYTDDLHDAGKINSSFDFDGADQYMTIPSTDLSSNRSLSFWSSLDTSGKPYVGCATCPLTYVSNVTRVSIDVSTQADGISRFAVPYWNTNTWYHYFIVRDGNDCHVYQNNIESASGAINIAGAMVINQIGRLAAVAGAFYNGNIDDFRLYDEVLTEDKRDAIYNSGAGSEDEFAGTTVSYTMKNMDDGGVGDEAGDFEVWYGLTPKALLLVGTETISGGILAHDFPPETPSQFYSEIRKDGISRSGIVLTSI